MAKKTAKRNIVTPDPKGVKTGISFEDLPEGDYFIMDEKLFQKAEDDGDQTAIDSLTGELFNGLCDEKVIPVTTTIAWEVK